eukprot:TRINITY_DN79639_c0_g1_i1.p1 TRINITY_DN79639_c0_g1~~TRINITY_DN79639_c0_g1_i1.p1  ORF type:complete len:162 (-),score=20.75 TRINITY_DN79639_c0_g1_i1:61-546(-)
MVFRRIVGRIMALNEWWEDLDIAEKYLLYMTAGMYWGTCYGTYCRRSRMLIPESDYLRASIYHVPEEKKKAFEANWSDQARLAQRQPGYEWTKTFKALDWQDSPFHYITFRMWSESGSYMRMTQFDNTWKELCRRVGDSCENQQDAVYRIIVDDSVRRIIE